jgi:hypothetical protein
MSRYPKNQGFIGGDDRLKKSDGGEVRVGRDASDVERTQNDGTAFSVEERRRMIRNEWKQEVLPTAPQIPGYHLCWLSTNSKVDPIHNRIRLGYEPVRASEVLGMEKFSMKDGEWSGFVSCNEMVLFKIPEDLYQIYMQEVHHNMPLEYESGIREQIEEQNAQTDSNGRKLGQIEGDGFEELGRSRRAPTFN